MKSSWFTYIIECKDGSFYTGCTNHLIRRWHQHRNGSGAKYLRAHPPEKVVFVEQQPTQSEACKREYEIKQYSKHDKKALIRSMRISG
jgi:putative endonuclease